MHCCGPWLCSLRQSLLHTGCGFKHFWKAIQALFHCGLARIVLCAVLLIVALLYLSGCTVWDKMKPTAKKGEIAAVNKAGADSVAANKKEGELIKKTDDASQARLASIRANADLARNAVKAIAESADQIVADGELGIVQARLSDTAPDAIELAAGAQRRLKVMSGNLEDARKAYAEKNEEAIKNATEIVTLRDQTRAAILEKNAALERERLAKEAFQRQLKENEEANNRKLQEAAEGVKKGQVRTLNIAGGVCMLIFGLGIGLGGIVGLRKTWIFGLIGLMCFGLAQIVAQWWFAWAVGGVSLLGVGAVLYFLWSHYKMGTLKQATEVKARQVTGALSKVVPVLEAAYETATPEVQSFLDQHVFGRIKMEDQERAIVREIKTQTQPPFPMRSTP